MKSKMSMVILLVTMKTMKNMNPIYLSISILLISLFSTNLMYKSTMSSWISFVTILTFSSGMMTLFVYTASLSSNEINKTKKSFKSILLLMLTLGVPLTQAHNTNKSMKMFSSHKLVMLMAIILILTLLAISSHGHHPNQTMNTSF